jgi:hypothetical protein
MAKYLLTCTCGRNVEVEQRQAGGRVTCSCGTSLEVPPLRKLLHLPSAKLEEEAGSAAWSPRNAVIAAALIGAMVTGGAAAYTWATMPALVQYDAELHRQDVDRSLDQMTPLSAWLQWISYYSWLDESGFSEFRPHNADAIEAERGRDQRLVQILGGIAGFGLLAAVIVALVPATAKRSVEQRVGKGVWRLPTRD